MRLTRHAAALAASVPLLAWAQPAEQSTLPAVTVTGEKTRRTLEHTATSVKVWTAADFDANPGLRSSRGLLDNTVNVTATGTQNLAPAVRGVDGTGPSQGSDAFLAGTRSRLSLVVDGRPASFNELSFGDLGLWDVERVEVFRGAQSTLQGRNAIAGSIIYTTSTPSFQPEYAVRAMLGNQQQRQVSALASGPLIDKQLAYRIAVDRGSSQSFVEGLAPIEGGPRPGRFETQSARAKLLFTPGALPGFKTVFSLARTSHSAPQTETVQRPFDEHLASYDKMPSFAPRVISASADTSWKLSEQWAFENTLVAGRFKVRRHAVPNDGSAMIDGRDWSLEPRLRYRSTDGGLNGFVGVYAFNARQHDTLDLFGGGAWDDRTQTRSLYGEASWALAPNLELTAGGRYEREHRFRKGSVAHFVTDFDERYGNFLPKLSLAWTPAAGTTLGAALSRGYNGGNAGFTYDEPYVSYEYASEHVWTLEGFARSRQLDGRLQLTGNLFLSRYSNMQLPFDLNPDPTVWAYVVRNAPRAAIEAFFSTPLDALVIGSFLVHKRPRPA
jgi:iron complex outermembrane receptor protein